MSNTDPTIEYGTQSFADKVTEVVSDYLSTENSAQVIIVGNPTDSNQVTPRKYVNLYGTTSSRPIGKIPAQQYFDTTIGRPVYFNPNSSVWTDGAGSVS